MQIKRRTLVIGLGGTGCKTISVLKGCFQEDKILPADKDLNDRINFDKRAIAVEKKNSAPIRFLAIDLDQREETYNWGANISKEFLNLNLENVENKVQKMVQETNESYKKWYPDPLLETITVGETQQGAGQWRPLGRLAYVEHQKIIENAITEAFSDLSSMNCHDFGSPIIEIVIIASTAGGTGSGMLLDVAYFIQNSLKRSFGKIQTTAFLVLPEHFKNLDEAHRTKANTYATLKEINCFYKQEKDFEMHYPLEGQLVESRRGTVAPFTSVYLFGSSAGRCKKSFKDLKEGVKFLSNIIYLRTVCKLSMYSTTISENNLLLDEKDMDAADESSTPSKDQRISLGCVFATCSGVILSLPKPDEVSNIIIGEVCDGYLNGDKEKVSPKYKEINIKLDELENDIKQILKPFDLISIEELWKRVLSDNDFNPDQEDFGEVEKEIKELDIGEYQKQIDHIIQAMDKALSEKLRIKDICQVFADKDEDGKKVVPAFHILKAMKKIEEMLEQRIPERVERTEQFSELGKYIKALNEKRLNVEKAKKKLRNVWVNAFTASEKEAKIFHPVIFAPLGSKLFIGKYMQVYKNELKDLSDLVQLDKENVYGITKDRIIKEIRELLLQYAHNSLSEGLKKLKSNISTIERLFEHLKIALPQKTAFKEIGNGQDEDSERELINRIRVSDISILNALEEQRQDVEAILHGLVNKEIFGITSSAEDKFNPALSDKCIIQDMALNDAPDFKIMIENFRKDLESAIKRGSIGINIWEYLNDFENMLNIADAGLFNNDQTHPCEVSRVFWSITKYIDDNKYPFRDKKQHVEFRNDVETLVKETFKGIRNSEIDDESYIMVAYHERRNQPAVNLPNIDEYYDQYMRFSRPKQLLHIHKDYFEELGEVYPKTIDPRKNLGIVTCGNSGCDYDIKDVPRDVVICPKCNNLILNRCGNSDCKVDNLLERLGMDIDAGEKICSSCNNLIRTFWWKCDKHGYIWRTVDETFCPDCNTEARHGLIKYSQRSMRIEEKRWAAFCQGCLETGIKNPFEIPLPELYFDVPDHKYPMLKKSLDKHKIKNNQCPKCSAQIYPICPHQDEDTKEVHYVVKDKVVNEGRLTCTHFNSHKEDLVEIYQCFHCDFPVKKGAKNCPKCFMELSYCTNCSNSKGYMIPAKYITKDRDCPICKCRIEKAGDEPEDAEFEDIEIDEVQDE